VPNPPTNFPLLGLPSPVASTTPKGHGGGRKPKVPTRARQVQRLGPQFARLQSVLSNATAAISLRSDPTSIAPERAIVFEVAGDLDDFYRAVQRIPGLEYLAEGDTEFPPDQDFAVVDTRRDTRGQPRMDKPLGGKVYLAMPDLEALREFVRLWNLWSNNQPLPRNFAVWRHLFSQLKALRPWGPQDRIPSETIQFWQEQLQQAPGQPVRTEIELWFHQSAEARARAFTQFETSVAAAGGCIIHHAVIPEISYDAALVDIPAEQIPALIVQGQVRLALADEVMFLRPQAVVSHPTEIESAGNATDETGGAAATLPPIAALFDGVPVQQHTHLADRLIIDDPDGLEAMTTVTCRVHGTAMASLILYGDFNDSPEPLPRKLYVRPLMYAPSGDVERTQESRLLIDTIYRAIKRMKEGDQEGGCDSTAGVSSQPFDG
jgi:hypothetical protein